MRTSLARALAACAALAVAGSFACSFVEDYDLDGKPCSNGTGCREGYVCVQYNSAASFCRHLDGGSAAAIDAGHSTGTADGQVAVLDASADEADASQVDEVDAGHRDTGGGKHADR